MVIFIIGITIGTQKWLVENLNQSINNSSGFNVLPAGYAYNFSNTSGTSFTWLNQYTYWWSSTQIDSSKSWARSINYSSSGISRENNTKCRGMSVRCIKD